jgi:hypothetical protein
MARTPAPEVKITEGIQPAATVHDTYWRPAQPEPSPLHAVARSLASLSEDLSSTFGKMDAQAAHDAKAAGETAFWTGAAPGQDTTGTGVPAPTSEAIAEGTRKGLLPLWGSKASRQFEEGYQGAAGLAAGAPMQGRVMEAYTQLPSDVKLNMTPEQLDAWVLDTVRKDPASAAANKNPAFARGIGPQYREIYGKVTDAWNKEKNADALTKAQTAWGSAMTTTLEETAISGKGREGGVDYSQATANIEAIRQSGYKAGLTQDAIDKLTAKVVIERATLDRDPTMLTILDNLKTPDGKPLSTQIEVNAARNTAATQIANLREQDRQRAVAEQDRFDKKAHDGSLRVITEGFMKDTNYVADPKDIANVYRRDPQAEATVLKLRQSIADGKQFEDPDKIATLTRDIYNGGGWDALRRGMGDIKTAATLKAAREAVINMETYTQGDSKLFEAQSWKRLENLITDQGKPPQIGGSAFREPTLTAASLAALNDVRVLGLKWAQANPGATGLEKEQFISELTKQMLPAIQASPDGTPVYTQPEAVGKARQGMPANPAATPAAAPANAPAGSPAAPAGSQNPMLAPGSNSTGQVQPPSIKPWIIDLAKSPDKPPRYEDMKGLGAEYRKDIEDLASKVGKDPQWVIDKTWEKLRGNIDAARKAIPPGAPQAAPAQPQAPVPSMGPRTGIDIPGLGKIDLASIPQDQIMAIAGQVMQRVDLSKGSFELPGGARLQLVPAGQTVTAGSGGGGAGVAPPQSEAFPIQRASFTPGDPATSLAMAATQEGVDLGPRLRGAPPSDPPGLGITATNGGPVVGQGLQQVSQRRVAQIDAKPTGAIIDRVAKQLGFPADVAKAMAHIESSGNPDAVTGSYKGLFQLSNEEFRKYGPNDGRDIMDPEANAYAGLRSMQAKSAAYEKQFGRKPSPTEIYLMHQQGEGGARAHASQPNRKAWESMYSTAEGQRKGEEWAKKAVWGNVPSDMRGIFGNVDNITSGQFIAVWINKLQGVPYQQALALINSGAGPKVTVADNGSI